MTNTEKELVNLRYELLADPPEKYRPIYGGRQFSERFEREDNAHLVARRLTAKGWLQVRVIDHGTDP